MLTPLPVFKGIQSTQTAYGAHAFAFAPFHAALVSTQGNGPGREFVRPRKNARVMVGLARGE